MNAGMEHDVFVSHAGEDKPYALTLVEALENAGLRVWFDATAMSWGDDLRSSIDRGLTNSSYGIVIFSEAFLRKKRWTEYELSALFARERHGKKVILPIWHGVTQDDLAGYSPFLSDRIAKISGTDSVEDIAGTILRLLGRDEAIKLQPDRAAAHSPYSYNGRLLRLREIATLASGQWIGFWLYADLIELAELGRVDFTAEGVMLISADKVDDPRLDSLLQGIARRCEKDWSRGVKHALMWDLETAPVPYDPTEGGLVVKTRFKILGLIPDWGYSVNAEARKAFLEAFGADVSSPAGCHWRMRAIISILGVGLVDLIAGREPEKQRLELRLAVLNLIERMPSKYDAAVAALRAAEPDPGPNYVSAS